MRKKFIFIVCIGFFVIFLFSPLKAVNNYSSTEYGYTQMDETFGIPRVITSINNDDFSGSEEEIAQQYLSYNSYYLFQTLTPEIEITKSITNPAGTHIRFHQEENNIPVIDSGIIISLNNKKEITMLVNNYKPEISVSTSPSVTLKQAIQIARNSFENSEFDTAIPIEGELSIYVESDETYYLVWKLNIILLDFTDWYILVNALNGDILKKKNITVNAYGNVFDPDPGTYFEDYTLPDSSDADYSDLSDAYQYEELNDLNASVGGLYYIQGKYAHSIDWPNVPPYGVCSESTAVFQYDRSEIGFEEVNCYYHLDKMIRYVRGLGFDPEWDNTLGSNSEAMVFDARCTFNDNAIYQPNVQNILFGYPGDMKDTAEDQSCIIHELGHALAHACMGEFNYGQEHFAGVTEGISDYLGIEYRRQISDYRPNDRFNWFLTDADNPEDPSIVVADSANFEDLWTGEQPHDKMKTWASSLMDLEYTSAIDPDQGIRLGRDVVTTIQLASLASMTSSQSQYAFVFALYQTDINIYEGIHLKDLIEVFTERQLFDDQLIEDNVTSNTTWEGYKLLQDTIYVNNNADLTISSSSNVVVTGGLVVESGCDLIISSNSNFYIHDGASIVIEDGGSITLNDTIKFFTPDGDDEGILDITGNGAITSRMLILENFKINIDDSGLLTLNNPSFEYSSLYAEDTDVSIDDGLIIYSEIAHNREDLDLNNVLFYGTQVEATMPGFTSLSEIVTIDSCTFLHDITQSAVYLNSYPNYEITNNEFNSQARTCVYIYESGYWKTHIFEDNEIDGNSGGSAVYLYDGSIDFKGLNYLHDNEYGIYGSNNSNLYIKGDQTSPYQRIMENDEGIKVTHNSFPTTIEYNDIKDNDDYHINCTNHTTGTHDVENNFWGSPNNPTGFLYPSTGYDYLPVWTHRGIRNNSEAKFLYETAIDLIVDNSFSQAQLMFKDIIETYPETEYAKGSLKKLLSLEKMVNDDYNSLQQYYLTDSTIISSSELNNLAHDMANYCNLYLREFEDAIGYYEDIIQDPPAEMDSIFAVIDAGYTYLLMEDLGYRSDFVGKIPSLKPESWIQFEKIRDQLLGLRSDEEGEDDLDSIIPQKPVLNDNYPNPFNPTTTLSFLIPEESRISLVIYNIKGQIVKTLIDTDLEKGNHSVEWNGVNDSGNSVSSGVYFYRLKVNGEYKSVKKCLLLK